MHYYKRHLGDYAKKAGHLSPLEHGVYTLILDSYYDREQAPTLMEATRWARARTEEEKSAVLAVLDEFFTQNGDRYVQKRVEEELDSYRGRAETNRKISVKREEQKRARKANEDITHLAPNEHESCFSGEPNQEPLTINHKDTPIPPSGATDRASKKSRAAISLKTYMSECKADGIKPIRDEDTVFDYAAEVGISHDVLSLQWSEFRARYSEEGAKRYKDWPTVFRKSVRGNWFKLWYLNDKGECCLTTVGIQARNAAEAAKRKAA